MSPVRTILHPTDFSPHSEAAFQVACELARDQGARLVALHVAVPPVVMYDKKGALLPRTKDYREVAKESLATLQAPGVKLEARIEEGEVGVAILRTANEIKADFIVMGTQGRSGLDRLLIGSVAADVLRKASCPVVTVRVPHNK